MKKLEGKPFALVGVNSDGNREALKPVLAKEQITWRSFWNGPFGIAGPISNAWGVQAWPTMYLIDHKGVIRRKFLGVPSTNLPDRAIDELVKEAGGG